MVTREDKLKMREAHEKAEAQIAKMALAQDPNNVEFWEDKLKQIEQMASVHRSQLAEVEFMINCYKEKVAHFKGKNYIA